MNELVDWGSSMPFGHFWLPGPNGWWVFGLYAAIGLTVLFPNLRPARRWGAALLAVWVMCGFVASPMARTFLSTPGSSDDPAEFRCTFLAMGHGLAVVMELPDGQVLIYDAGQLGSPVAAGRNVAGYLWARGITHVDAVVVSHADLDHYNGIPDIAERFSIGVVYVSPMMFEAPATSLSALTAALERHAIPIRILKAPDRLATHPRCRIDVLHPGSSGMLGSDNANSLVLAVEAYGRRILLTGDLESPGVEAVLAEVPYDCDVLLAPHHGSARSNPAGFAQWSRPEHVIVSGGYEVNPNVFAAYQQVGANVLHTAAVGAVTVQVREDRLTVRTFRSSHETH
jgi:competence protein ComEC